jgi:nucleotide-binding universal stress UspA family protein
VRAEGREGSFVVHRGEPAARILEAAPAASDLLVMATRGLSRVKRTLLGSVAEEVVTRAKGPVLVGRTFPEAA